MSVRDVQRDGYGVAILTTPQAIALAEYHRHDPSGEATPAMRSPLGGDLDAHIAMYEEDDRPIIEALAAWIIRAAPVVVAAEARLVAETAYNERDRVGDLPTQRRLFDAWRDAFNAEETAVRAYRGEDGAS